MCVALLIAVAAQGVVAAERPWAVIRLPPSAKPLPQPPPAPSPAPPAPAPPPEPAPDGGGKTEPTVEFKWRTGAQLTDSERLRVEEALEQRRSAFAFKLEDMQGYSGPEPEYAIDLVDDWEDKAKHTRPRAKEKPRPLSPSDAAVTDEKCQALLDMGFIEEADTRHANQFAANVLVAPKKDAKTGEWTDTRWCIDYRGLNLLTQTDTYQLPYIEELFDSLDGAALFTTLDARNGFGNITIRQEDRHKTAFWWKRRLYQNVRLPFGLKNAPAAFQRIMEATLDRAGIREDVYLYIDDILIVTRSNDVGEHMRRVDEVLRAFEAVGIKMHPEKSDVCSDTVEYLGHRLHPNGRGPQEAKVAAIQALTEPKSLADLRSRLGFIQYYSQYIGPSYSLVARPLTVLTKKDMPWQWGEAQRTAFNTLKQALCTAPVLQPPRRDRRFIVHCDWSKRGIGAVLTQLDDDEREFVVCTTSRTLNSAEQRYSPFYGECLGVVYAVKQFRQYLHGKQFLLVTDHRPLQWLLSQEKLSSHHGRWALAVAEFDFVIVHRAGDKHQNADALSRSPQDRDDTTDAQLDRDALNVATPHKPLTVFTLERALRAYHAPTGAAPSRSDVAAAAYGRDHLEEEQHTPQAPRGKSFSRAELATEATAVLDGEFDVADATFASTFRNYMDTWVSLLDTTATSAHIMDTSPAPSENMPDSTPVGDIFWEAADREVHVIDLDSPLLPTLLASVANDLPLRSAAGLAEGAHLGVMEGAADYILRDNAGRGRPLPVYLYQKNDIDVADAVVAMATRAGPHAAFLVSAAVPAASTCQACALWYRRVLRVIRDLQRHAPGRVGYIIVADDSGMCTRLGHAVLFDATQLGATVPKRIALTTNLTDRAWLRRVLHARPSRQTDQRPNLPLADLEVALGWHPGASDSGLTADQRRDMLHRHVDGRSIAVVLAAARRYRGPTGCAEVTPTTGPGLRCPPTPPCSVACCGVFCLADRLKRPPGGGADLHHRHAWSNSSGTPICRRPGVAVALAASPSRPAETGATSPFDPFSDDALLAYLRDDIVPSGKTERRRVLQKAQAYEWESGTLYKVSWHGGRRVLPPPHERAGIVRRVHEQSGHYKVRRCVALLKRAYHFPGMEAAARACVHSCAVCDRVGAAFGTTVDAALHPLPITFMFYRWHLDFAEKLVATPGGNTDVLIAVDAFTKYAVVVAMGEPSAAKTRDAFRDRVVTIFGAPAEVVTDRGSLFRGIFDEYLDEQYIEHRRATARHPQSNGMAERIVQVIKAGLKHALEGGATAWDEVVADVCFVYNITPQASTRFAPYSLVYAREVPLPAKFREALDLTELDAGAAGRLVADRAITLRRKLAAASANLEVAQARDRFQRARKHVRSAEWDKDALEAGDFVYVRRPDATGLEARAKTAVLRVVRVSPMGTITVEGRNGVKEDLRRADVAPCRLPVAGLDDDGAHHDVAAVRCQVCDSARRGEDMLLCVVCARGWHGQCLSPAVNVETADDDWACPDCVTGNRVPRVPDDVNGRNDLAHSLDGRRGARAWIDERGLRRPYAGVLRHTGDSEMKPLTIEYDDGHREDVTLTGALIFVRNGDRRTTADARPARRRVRANGTERSA